MSRLPTFTPVRPLLPALALCLLPCLLVPPPALALDHLRLATTTSVNDTGLLKALNAAFEKGHDARVSVMSVGSGAALELGRKGKVDVVLVHAPEAEVLFMTEGFGVDRRAVMHNDFVLLGPADDPAGVRGEANPVAALVRIASKESTFVSRADGSGTYQKEKALWWHAGILPNGRWYIRENRGMGETLASADNLKAYTLCDRGTYMAYGSRITLAILVEGSPVLVNPYHVILVNPALHPDVRHDLARAYADFLTGPEGQAIIREFRVGGQALFFPDAKPSAAPVARDAAN
jgi:tungstate transport system substrate-binding protein